MNSFEDFASEMKTYHNDICVLYDSEIVRLVGVHQDTYDFYYTVKSLDKKRGSFYYASAVGHLISLKGIYPSERYDHMNDVFNINGATEETEFLITEDHVDKDYGLILGIDPVEDDKSDELI